MRKFLFLASLMCALFMSTNAKAEGTTYYGKCSVEVAEDSKGLGTVYIDDNGEHVMEITKSEVDYNMVGGGTMGVDIYNTPADGYVFANFTDQYGQVYYYPEDALATGPNIISMFITSQDEANPTTYVLSAHFVKEGDLPKNDLAEVTVSSSRRFGTFMAPVDAEIPSEMVAYKVNSVDEEHIYIQELEGTVPAFTPVLVENISLFDTSISATYDSAELPDPLPSMTAGVLTGTLEEIMAPVGSYVLPDDEDVEMTDFVIVSNEETPVAPYTCYMTVDSENPADAYKINLATAVKTITAPECETTIFSVDGRRLERLEKGINIVNGVKVIVK